LRLLQTGLTAMQPDLRGGSAGPLSVPASTPRFDFYAQPELLLWALGLWHLLFWVLVPLATYRMLPLDTLELLGWGQEWQWGYYKHPPLGAWLGEFTLWLSGNRLGGIYVLSQLCVLLTLFYVWKTARLFLDRHAAVMATALLEGAYWYTYLTPNFNMNTLQLPVWAGLSYHFIRALRGDVWHWGAWGLFVALCLLSKYSGLLIVATCMVIIVFSETGRRSLRGPAPYVGGLLAVIVLIPHLIWLSAHWQLPWNYLRGFDRLADSAWYQHVLEPLRFAGGALLGLLISGMLFLTLRDARAQRPPWRSDAWLPLALCVGPLLISMLYGALSGSRLKSTWAFAFFNLAGVVWFVYLPTRIDRERFRRFCISVALIALTVGGAHVLYKTQTDRSKTSFDGAALTRAIVADWDASMHTPLRLVIGDHMLTAIVSTYAPTRPSMLVHGDFAISLWATPADLQEYGAVVVCAHPSDCYPELTADAVQRRRVDIGPYAFDYYFLAPAQNPD
jgi:4-amino-4-deoxy-L-arabinose transferase-like glycosyltransferase